MRSLQLYPDVKVALVYDRDAAQMSRFCEYWNVPGATSLQQVLDSPECQMVLNLTNPSSHYEISRTCLLANKHVYSEKPLAITAFCPG